MTRRIGYWNGVRPTLGIKLSFKKLSGVEVRNFEIHTPEIRPYSDDKKNIAKKVDNIYI